MVNNFDQEQDRMLNFKQLSFIILIFIKYLASKTLAKLLTHVSC